MVCRTIDEIKAVFFSFKPFKAPRPNGLHLFFYQNYCNTVGPSMIDLCLNSLNYWKIHEEINETHVCLIPKIKEATTVREFRPICLCNITYKIITKIISNRLKPIMNSLIGPHQISFLQNRQAGDNTIIVQEAITHFQKAKGQNPGMLLKIDLRKLSIN